MNKTGPGAFSMIESDHVQTDGITEEDIVRMFKLIEKELDRRGFELCLQKIDKNKQKRSIDALEQLKFD